MKENFTQLYPNEQVSKAVGEYAYKHSTPLPTHITEHHAWGSNHEKSDYMISPLQAQFQLWIAKAVGAKRILEIGTFIGFSTTAWSEAVGPTGHVTALESSPEYAKIAEETFAKNNITNTNILIGDARASIATLPGTIKEPYDLIFIDADKSSYPTYLTQILSLSATSGSPSGSVRLLKPGGIIIADNILRRGLIADSSDANPWTKPMQEQRASKDLWKDGDLKYLDDFNKALVGEKRLETFLMPMFDGLGMARLVD